MGLPLISYSQKVSRSFLIHLLIEITFASKDCDYRNFSFKITKRIKIQICFSVVMHLYRDDRYYWDKNLYYASL